MKMDLVLSEYSDLEVLFFIVVDLFICEKEREQHYSGICNVEDQTQDLVLESNFSSTVTPPRPK